MIDAEIHLVGTKLFIDYKRKYQQQFIKHNFGNVIERDQSRSER